MVEKGLVGIWKRLGGPNNARGHFVGHHWSRLKVIILTE